VKILLLFVYYYINAGPIRVVSYQLKSMHSSVRAYKHDINKKSYDVIEPCFRVNKIMLYLEKIDVFYLFSVLFCGYGFIRFFYKASICIDDVKMLKKEVLELQKIINKKD